MSKIRNTWIADIETYKDTFTLVCVNAYDRTKWLTFVITDVINDGNYLDYEDFISFLETTPSFIGYNWINFDAQIIEAIWRREVRSVKEIYKYAQKIIEELSEDRFNTPYKEWELSFPSMDLFKIWHFDRTFVSLKQLEFFTRRRGIHDLPYPHDENLDEKKLKELIKYNKKDVEFTAFFFDQSKERIEDRNDAYKLTGDPLVYNKSDTSLAEFEFSSAVAEEIGCKRHDLKNIPKAQYSSIKIKDILFDYYDFRSPEAKAVYDNFKKLVINKKGGEFVLKGVLEADQEYHGNSLHYGLGGAHYCVPSGDYQSKNGVVIWDLDVASYYPNLAIQNNVSISHFPGNSFIDTYKNKYEERKQWPKGSSMNKRLKLQLNSIYGKSNEYWSAFYDPKYTCTITVNGQLSLLNLVDWVCDEIPSCIPLQLNTDGCTFMLPKVDVDKMFEISKKWEELTKLTLEAVEYSRMVIRDVNNYWAQDVDGKIKRKGFFAIYEDYINDGEAWKKNPSMLVIPSAINAFLKGESSVEDYINNENNIHEFMQGIKKTKAFDLRIWRADDEGRVYSSKKDIITDRYVRYYISKRKVEGENKIYGGSLFKHWNDGRITGLNVDQLVNVCQYLMSEKASLHKSLDRQYYIDKANETLKDIGLI